MLTLIDRKLIVLLDTDELSRAAGVTPAHADHPIEKAALEFLQSPGSVANLEAGLTAHPVLESYRERLVRIGLLPGPKQNRHRFALWIAGFGLLLVVAAVKVAIGLSRSRPVPLLIGSCVFFAFATLTACFQPLTAAGDEVVAHMEELFSSLKRRIGWRPPASRFTCWRSLTRTITTKRVDVVRRGVRPRTDPQEHHAQLVAAVSKTTAIVEQLERRSSCGGGGCGGGCGGCSG